MTRVNVFNFLSMLAGLYVLPMHTLAADDPIVSVEAIKEAAPGARTGAAAVYDSRRSRLIVFGGGDAEKQTLPTALMSFDPRDNRWESIETKGDAPQGIFHPALAYDQKRDQLVLFGGWAKGAPEPSAELWVLPLDQREALQWKLVSSIGPSARNGTCLLPDESRDRLILFAGDTGADPRFGFKPVNDVWTLHLADMRWAKLVTTGDIPSPRWNMSATVVPEWELLFVFGGAGHVDGRLAIDADVHVLHLGSLKWSKRPARGEKPFPTEGSSLTFDPKANALVLAGGLSLSEEGDAGPNSVWLFDLTTEVWTKHQPKIGFPRRDHVGVYDPESRRHIIFGGAIPKTRGNFFERGDVLGDAVRITVRKD